MYQCLLTLTTLVILKIYVINYRCIIFGITENEAVYMFQISYLSGHIFFSYYKNG